MTRFRRILRSLGPAVTRPALPEMLRAALGAGIGLTLCTALVRLTVAPVAVGTGPDPTLLLIAPLGATAFLAFAVPSSPLAQPYSAIVGNTASALVGVLVVMTISEPWLALGLSVTLAMLAMMALRAMHPPAAGVALGAVLSAASVRDAGFAYAFSPVFLDTVLLLAVAVVYNRMTGRMYPFRQPPQTPQTGAGDTGLHPVLEAQALAAILQRLRLDANIGPADLGRVIEAARVEAAAHLFDGVRCEQVMTRDPVSLPPDMPVSRVAAIFRKHRVRTLPVKDATGRYAGLVSEAGMLRKTEQVTRAARRSEGKILRLLRAGQSPAITLTAADVMDTQVQTATPQTTLAKLITMLAAGGQQAVPVLDQAWLVGLVTRTDLIKTLARSHRGPDPLVQPADPGPDTPPSHSKRPDPFST